MCVCDKIVRESACVCVRCVATYMHVLCVRVYVCVRMCMNCRSRKEQTCRSRTSSIPVHISRRAHASFRRGNQNQWQLQQTYRIMFNMPRKVMIHVAKCHTCTQSAHPCHQVPRLPRKVKVDVAKYTCHERAAAPTAPNGNQARHRSQPSATSATPATQSDDQCRQEPCLPRKMTVDVAKRHACHANSGDAHGANREPSAKCHASLPSNKKNTRSRHTTMQHKKTERHVLFIATCSKHMAGKSTTVLGKSINPKIHASERTLLTKKR